MAKKWSEVASSPAFKALKPEEQDGARQQYFDEVVAPQVPPNQHEAALEQFSTDTGMGRRELPAGVAPSNAGGGRGSINPGSQPAAASAQPAQEVAQPGDASGAGDAAAIMAAAQPARTSVLEGRTMPDLPFNAGEAERLSNRAYAEATPQPGTPQPRQTLQPSGPRVGPTAATERGEALQDASLPVRAAFKAVSGAAEGAGGVLRAVGDMAGSDALSAAGAATAKGAEEFQQGMGETGAVAGFGPKSPVPYLSGQAEGAASSLAQSAALASMFGARAVIPLMSIQTAGTEYDKARNAGMDPAAALAGAIPKGAFEAIGEKFSGLDKVAGAMGTLLTKGASTQAKKGAADILVKAGIKEIPGEVITYLGQTGVDALPGIGLNPDITMGQFIDGLRDTVVQAGMMGTAMGAGGAALRTDPRIKLLREAGETGAADLLQRRQDTEHAEAELTGMAPLAEFAATPEFQADYRTLRTEGVKPVEAAARSALTSTFRTLATGAGMSEKAMAAGLEAAKKVGIDKLPAFIQRYTRKFVEAGAIQPIDGVDTLDAQLEQQRDHAMNAAMGVTLKHEGGVRDTMNGVEALESSQNTPLAQAEPAPAATELIADQTQPTAELPASAELDMAAHDAATSPLNARPEPTQAQKEAGNYKVGRINLHGLNISIENPEGSVRRGVDPETGKPWENELAAHYGYIRGTEGNDGDHVDTFIGPNPASDKVFVIDQVNKDGSFDEHKVMLGADSLEQADELYHANYAPGWTGRGAITEMPLADFKAWVRDGVKTQPLGSQVTAAQKAALAQTNKESDATNNVANSNVQNTPVRPPVSTEATAKAAPAEAGTPAGGEAEGPAAAGSSAGAAALEAPRVTLGRNNVPLAEGGKPFKTRLAADEARKLQPAMRVIRSDGGFALTEKSPSQLAAQEKAARRLRNPQTSAPGQPIPAHAMIAAAGGLAPAERADMGVEGNVTVGNRKLFGGEGKGLTIERATEKLIEEGYLPEGAGHEQARALIKKSLAQPQYTADGFERMADAEAQARFDAAMTPEEAVDDAVAQIEALSDNQFDALLDAEIEWDAPSNTSTEAAMKALGFTDQEIQDATANQSGEPQDDRSGRGEPDEGAARQAQADSAGRSQTARPTQEVKNVEDSARSGSDKGLQQGPVGEGDGQSTGSGGSAEAAGGRRNDLRVDDVPAKPRRNADPNTADRSAEVTQTPADAGVSTSAPAFESKLRDDGTLAITGDAKAIRELLTTIPAKSLMGMRGGILVGRTQADKAAVILRGETPKLSAREAAEAGQAARDAEKKAKQAAARAKPAPSGLTVGMMPSNAEPVTVKDGVVFIGKNEAINFDSGEPVTVPAGATDQQIVNALKDAGALSRRQRVFGLAKEEGEGLTAPTKDDVLAQQQRKEEGDRADAKATAAAENKAKADAARGEFTLTGSDRAADVGAAGGQNSMFARSTEDQTDTPAFKAWFGQSVVTKDGKAGGTPMVVYHGTAKAFPRVNMKKGAQGLFWMTTDKAAIDAGEVGAQGRGAVMDLYATIKNPAGWKDYEQKSIAELKRDGYDGIILPDPDGSKTVVVFEPNQVKSASRNNGDFDATNPYINFARKGFDADAFSRMFRPPTAMAVSDVQKAVDQLAKGWKSGPRIKVVATPAELPIDAPADARGLIHNGTTYVVASNHLNRDGVARTVGHEVVGHYGLWRMLGEDGQKRFERNLQLALKSGNVPLGKIAAKVRDAYVDGKGKFNLSPTEEANEIAAFAVEAAIDPATGEFKPGFGFVKEVFAKVADFLRKLGIYVKFTNFELHGMLMAAMRGLKAGHKLEGGGQVMVAAARDGAADVGTVLLELGRQDGIFQMPRSESRDLTEIAMAKGLKVAPVDRNSTDNKLWMLANTTPADAPGVRSWIVTLPNGKHGTLTNDNGKVYINVSSVGEGNRGNAIYDLAANYAATNGLQFIGDPNGVSPAAMRRRLENMLSSAVKYGTTNHLAPHPDQLEGNKAIGVPPLQWTEGDTVGNINAMVAASTAATEASNPVSTSNVNFDAATQSFRDGDNNRLDDASLSAMLGFDGRESGTGSAGRATLQRNALFRALLQSEGARRAFLEQLRDERRSGSAGTGDGLKGSFYARDGAKPPVDQTDTPAFKKWFGDSKVVDDAGKPLVVYHGTNKLQGGDAFTMFDSYGSNYGLFGQGAYFTENPDVASSYVTKGKGSAPTVYAAYMRLKNPIDMDAKADPAAWVKQFPDAEVFHEGGDTNESWYRAAEDAIRDQEVPMYEGAEMMQDGLRQMGYDGITHVGGGRVKSEGVKHQVYIAFDPEQIKSAIGNNGEFDGGNPNIAFARGTGNLFKPNIWTTPEPTRTDRVIYELQDGKVDLKRVQEAIKKSGQEITEQYDARLAETLYPGRVAYRSKTFLDNEAKPLLEAMARNKVEMDELADYLHARGAQERNAQIAKVNPNMPDGGAGTNTKGVLMTDAAAAAYLANVGQAKRVVLDAMAKRVDAITAGTRKMLVDEGLEKQETIDAWEGAYKNYVPMFRDEAETGFPPHPQGSGFAVKGSASKRATGSTKEVTNILAHVLMQREAAITRAEKNRVALALYGQALSHPNPDFWTTIRPSMKAEEIGAELAAMGVDPMTAEVGMNGVPTIRTVDPITQKVVDRPNPIYKNLPGAIPLKVNGADRVLMLNVENERGRRLAESLKNLDGLTQLDLAGSIIGKATRWMAAVNTQYNPAFGLVNLSRDVLEGAINLGATELRGNSTRVLAQVPLAIQGIARELANDGKGGNWGKLYKEFVAEGGQTGFKENFRDPNERARAVEKELERMHSAGKLTPGNAAHAALDLLDGFNTTLENAVRLSAYKVGLEKGMSKPAAARLARELTVDFNRKGRMGREVGPMYAFFNASVQGAERALRTLRGPTGGRIIAGGLTLGVLQALMLAAAGYDDDEVPEYVKTRAFVIPLNWTGKGEKKHILIPLPLGFLMVPNTGRVLTELTLNGGKDMGKRIVEAVGTIAGSFNPLGGGNIFTPDGALRTLAPTVVDPLIELGFNKNFAGSPIEKQAYGSETDGRPGAARAKESTQRSTTGQAYIGISKAINTLAGGTPYQAGVVSPTPERVRYIAQTVGGGVLREVEKTINASTAAAAGGKVKSSQIPVLGRFYGEVDDDQVAMTRYYEGSKKLKTLESSLNAAKKAGDGAAMVKMLEEHPEAAFIKAQSRVQSEISKLNKAAVGTVDNPEVMKVIDSARVEKMKALTGAIEEMERARGKVTLGDRINPRRKPEVAAAPP